MTRLADGGTTMPSKRHASAGSVTTISVILPQFVVPLKQLIIFTKANEMKYESRVDDAFEICIAEASNSLTHHEIFHQANLMRLDMMTWEMPRVVVAWHLR